MKRLGVVLLVSLMLMGCSLKNKDEDYQPPLEIATEQSEYIMECVVNKDKEGLKSVFSKHIAETHDLDKEIDEFFKFIDGEIISYDAPEGNEGGYTRKDGEYTEKVLNGYIRKIETDNKKHYEIISNSYYIYKNNKEYEGVFYLSIINKDLWGGEKGFPKHGKKIVGEQMQ